MTIETTSTIQQLPAPETTEASVAPEAVPLKRAILYLRVSTSKQATRNGEAEGYSISAQRSACERKVSDLGAEVVREFVDAGASARSADRDGGCKRCWPMSRKGVWTTSSSTSSTAWLGTEPMTS